MCKHVFRFPEGTKENYNLDRETITGVCKHCGAKQDAYGLRWVARLEEKCFDYPYYGSEEYYIDKSKILC